MQQVMVNLVERLEVDVSRQRLDSTHVQSNMATFGCTRLMGVAIKGFLIRLLRTYETAYGAISEYPAKFDQKKATKTTMIAR